MKERRRGATLPKGFYAAALNEAEAELLAAAREVAGLDEEIALLRLRLRRLVEEHPEQTDLLFKGVGLLVRAVAARYRLSEEAEENLFQSLEAVVRSVGGVVGGVMGAALGGGEGLS